MSLRTLVPQKNERVQFFFLLGSRSNYKLNAQGSRRVLYPACIRGFTLLGRIGVIRLFI